MPLARRGAALFLMFGAAMIGQQLDYVRQIQRKPLADVREYAYTRTSGASASGSLLTAGSNTVTVSPCPYVVAGSTVYISGGFGAAEAAPVTGGTCTGGPASSGTIVLTTSNAHSSNWALASATGGLQEALCSVAATGADVYVPAGAIVLNSNIGWCGATKGRIVLSRGATVTGTGTLPTSTGFGYIVEDYRATTASTDPAWTSGVQERGQIPNVDYDFHSIILGDHNYRANSNTPRGSLVSNSSALSVGWTTPACAAVVSATNLVVDASTNTKVTSASHTFVTSETFSTLTVTGGSGWTSGSYLINSISGGAAFLNSSPAAVGVTGGQYTLQGCPGATGETTLALSMLHNNSSNTGILLQGWGNAGTDNFNNFFGLNMQIGNNGHPQNTVWGTGLIGGEINIGLDDFGVDVPVPGVAGQVIGFGVTESSISTGGSKRGTSGLVVAGANYNWHNGLYIMAGASDGSHPAMDSGITMRGSITAPLDLRQVTSQQYGSILLPNGAGGAVSSVTGGNPAPMIRGFTDVTQILSIGGAIGMYAANGTPLANFRDDGYIVVGSTAFGGVSFAPYTFAQMTASSIANMNMIMCTNCKGTADTVTTGAVCVSGGTGTLALRQNGTWRCY